MSFKNDKQRKAAFANMKNQMRKEYIDPISKNLAIPKINNTPIKPTNTKKQKQKNGANDGNKTGMKLTTEQKEIRQKEIRAMIEWSGCVAIPQHCIIIKGVNKAYDLYKAKNRLHFENVVKNATEYIINQTLENPIDIYSDSIFKIISNRGFIDNIPIEIKFDENIFQDMIQGTISNMTKNSTKALIDYTVDKI